MEDKKTTTRTATAGGTQNMINILENNNAGNNSTSADFLHSMSDLRSFCLWYHS